MCIKQPTIKRWRINWGVMVDRQMPFDDKVSKLNRFSQEPLLLRLCLQLGLLIHTFALILGCSAMTVSLMFVVVAPGFGFEFTCDYPHELDQVIAPWLLSRKCCWLSPCWAVQMTQCGRACNQFGHTHKLLSYGYCQGKCWLSTLLGGVDDPVYCPACNQPTDTEPHSETLMFLDVYNLKQKTKKKKHRQRMLK